MEPTRGRASAPLQARRNTTRTADSRPDPISLLFIILINAHILLPDGYFLRMVRESRVDDLVELLDYRLSLQHEPADTRVLFDLNDEVVKRLV